MPLWKMTNSDLEMIVDDESYKKLKELDATIYYVESKYKIPGLGYAFISPKPSLNLYAAESVHRFLIGAKHRADIVDHINGNSLDNRLCNLRIVDYRTNTLNRKKLPSGGYTGVYRIETFNKRRENKIHYRAQIMIEGKAIRLGSFPTAYEAHVAYMQKYCEITGLNFLEQMI